MNSPMFFRFVVGSSLAVIAYSSSIIAISAYHSAHSFKESASIFNNKLNEMDVHIVRAVDAVERGMNKYAPPKK